MSTLADPLAKPVWPEVDQGMGESSANELETYFLGVRSDISNSVAYVGFNSVMAALETSRTISTIFVCRGDVPSQVAQSLGLASAALNVRLVTLPKGSAQRLTAAAGMDASIVGLKDGALPSLDAIVRQIGSANAGWAYHQAQTRRRPPKSER